MESSGSACIQPVKRMMSAARIAAAEPSRSPSTCRMAPRRLSELLSPPCRTTNTTTFTTRPSAAIDEHRPAEHRLRRRQPPDRLHADPQRDAEDRQPVRIGDEDLHPVEAVGHRPVPRPRAHQIGGIGERQRHGVGQHVAGIGDQRQRAREHAARRLRQHEAAGQDRRREDAPAVARIGYRRVRVAVPGAMVVAWL